MMSSILSFKQFQLNLLTGLSFLRKNQNQSIRNTVYIKLVKVLCSLHLQHMTHLLVFRGHQGILFVTDAHVKVE